MEDKNLFNLIGRSPIAPTHENETLFWIKPLAGAVLVQREKTGKLRSDSRYSSIEDEDIIHKQKVANGRAIGRREDWLDVSFSCKLRNVETQKLFCNDKKEGGERISLFKPTRSGEVACNLTINENRSMRETNTFFNHPNPLIMETKFA